MDKEFVPFGEEWEAEVMKLPKKVIIGLYRNVCLENNKNIPLDAEVSDDFCIWKYDEDDDTYFTKCDNGFQVMNGSLEDNHFSYCVYCGKKVKTKKLSKNSR